MLSGALGCVARLVRTPGRTFGLLDRFSGVKKQEQQFEKFLEFMKTKKQFGVVEFRQMVDDTATEMERGTIASLLGGIKEKEKIEVRHQRRILHAVLPTETDNPKVLEHLHIQKELAEAANAPLRTVKKVSRTFKEYIALHSYVQGLVKTGKPLPKSMNELASRFGAEYRLPWAEQKEQNRKMRNAREKMFKDMWIREIAKKRLNNRLRRLPYRTY